ncbi:glycosyltransferase 87 family protein [Sneathiella litorea]|uniref:DUF2029 domain-containing protein n=1 Tax=Sneathiella litorea TaxID=2606216 RepID=A0A6L8W9C9_9PROT|nr:glycosyltransferase 87 family protein [Sneathiella litorea]MZR31721.1 DUF2029 domain-containing protein [Sneathiella litorea]
MYRKITKDPANAFTLVFCVIISLFLVSGVIDYFWGFGYIFYELKAVLTHAMEQDDSWWPMYEAAQARRVYTDRGIYDLIFFEKGIKFQYPPVSLLPYMILIKFGFDFEAIVKISYTISFLAVFGIAFCGYRIVINILGIYGNEKLLPARKKLGIFVVTFLSVFTFHPIVIAQYLGQLQVLIDFLVSLTFLAWLVDRRHFAGMFLAAAALLKPQLILLLLWGIIRKEKAFTIGMLIVFVPAGIVSLAVFGFQEHLDYLRVLSHISLHGEAFWPNQSVNGLLSRLITDADLADFDPYSYSEYNPYVYFSTLASTILLVLFGLFYNKPKIPGSSLSGNNTLNSALDLATMVLLSIMASPTVWTHHYGVAWPIFLMAIMVAIILLQKERTGYAMACFALLCISYILVSNYFSFLDKEAYYDSPVNLVLSYFFYGGIFLLIALLLLRHALANRADDGS